MLQGITNVGMGSSSRLCIRCIKKSGQAGRPEVYSRSYTTVTIPLQGQGQESQDEFLAQSSSSILKPNVEEPNTGDTGSEPKARSTNVWGRMQESPKRQCILTRKTLPADYLLKLKPRYYPSPLDLEPTSTSDHSTGGTYLTPSLVNRSDPGRSVYLTAHREVISRIHEPGPHLGILSQNNILIPRKLDQWIQTQLEERLIKELEILVKKLRVGTSKAKNMMGGREQGGVVERYDLATGTSAAADDVDIDRLFVHLPLHNDESGIIPEPVDVSASTIDLRSFIPPNRPLLFKHISDLLAIDRKYLLRQALVNKLDMSQPYLVRLMQNSPSASGTGLEGMTISISSASTRGQIALPAMTALLRLKLYSGQGWK